MGLSNRLQAALALISVAVIWGIASVVIKGTLEYIPPMTFLYFRFLMLMPIIVPWYIWHLKKHPIKKKEFIPLTLFGLMATTVYLSLVFWGFERTTAIDGNLLGTLNPIFIILLGWIVLKEHISKWERIGLFITILGVFVMVIQPLLEGAAFPIRNIYGNTLILIATIIWAFFVLLSKKNFKHFSPILITLHGAIVAAVTYPILAYFEQGMVMPDFMALLNNPPAFWGVFYMAFISYVVAYILYEFGMSKIEISEGSLFTYLQPLIATPIAVLFLGEMVTIPFIIGAAMIAFGVVLSEWKW